MDLKELIEKLEFGYERAEGPEWVAFAINADNECAALIHNLRATLEELEELEELVERMDKTIDSFHG